MMFCDTGSFPFVGSLESSFLSIKSELMAVGSHEFLPYPETAMFTGTWEVCGFSAFGKKLKSIAAACPKTASLIDAIPGVTTAGFSRLGPNTHIYPHTGYSSTVLRCHLGLIVPSDGCCLRVGSEQRPWEEGKCLVFDDTTEHEAWNRSAFDRVVLLVDFLKDVSVRYVPPALAFKIPDSL